MLVAKNVHWDPFEGQVAAHQEKPVIVEVAKPIMNIWHWMALGVFGTCIVASVVFDLDALGVVGLVGTLGTTLWLAFKKPSQGGTAQDAQKQAFFYKLGIEKGWSFRLPVAYRSVMLKRSNGRCAAIEDIRAAAEHIFEPEHADLIVSEGQIAALAKMKTKHKNNIEITFQDPFFWRFFNQTEVFLGVSAVQLLPIRIESAHWGENSDGNSFWLALSVMNEDARRPDLRPDRAKAKNTVRFMLAYPLDRDTQVKAMLTGDVPALGGWRGEDTESDVFNRMFKVKLLRGEELQLTQALSPSTQTTLIDLHKRYSLELMLDGATLLVRGYAVLDASGEGMASDEAIEQFSAVVSDLMTDIFKLKAYIE